MIFHTTRKAKVKQRTKFTISIAIAFALGLASYKVISPLVKSVVNGSPKWDRVDSDLFFTNRFGKDFKVVNIPSSVDGAMQPAYFYRSTSSEPQPLVVSLHTWSGDYRQSDPLSELAKARGWNYIHPDSRGPNNRPDACLSDLVISDIDDAIAYAKKNANVSDVYVVGVSGGGYTALGYYLKGKEDVAKVMAWVPISNLKGWYYESVIKGNKYADDIMGCVSDKQGTTAKLAELDRRSPLLWETPGKSTPLEIYAGLNDSYIGSVSTSHSLNFYNKLAKTNPISDQKIVGIISRSVEPIQDEKIGDRKVYLREQDGNVSVTIFYGVHEMLPEFAIQSIIK